MVGSDEVVKPDDESRPPTWAAGIGSGSSAIGFFFFDGTVRAVLVLFGSLLVLGGLCLHELRHRLPRRPPA